MKWFRGIFHWVKQAEIRAGKIKDVSENKDLNAQVFPEHQIEPRETKGVKFTWKL